MTIQQATIPRIASLTRCDDTILRLGGHGAMGVRQWILTTSRHRAACPQMGELDPQGQCAR